MEWHFTQGHLAESIRIQNLCSRPWGSALLELAWCPGSQSLLANLPLFPAGWAERLRLLGRGPAAASRVLEGLQEPGRAVPRCDLQRVSSPCSKSSSDAPECQGKAGAPPESPKLGGKEKGSMVAGGGGAHVRILEEVARMKNECFPGPQLS